MVTVFALTAVFVSAVAAIWVGDAGIYLPLAGWTLFALGNAFGITRMILPGLAAATVSGFCYARGAGGFIEPLCALAVLAVELRRRPDGLAAAGTGIAGSVVGMCSAAVLIAGRLIGPRGADWALWCSGICDILFAGTVGLFLLPIEVWYVERIARRLGFTTLRSARSQL